MQCSVEEIERKRQQALQKLANKNKSPLKIQNIEQASGKSFPETKNRGFKFNNSIPKHISKPYEKSKETNNGFSAIKTAQLITAKCILSTDTRFIVDLTAFSSPAIEIFKTIDTRNYDTKTRQWSFSLKDYEVVIAKLNTLKGHLDIVPFPKFVLKCLRAPDRDSANIDISCIEPELRDSLMPFQKEGVIFGIDKGGRCLIADDMGLGKTFQALGIASYYRNDWPLLIVTTASMKNTWEETILKFLPSVPVMNLQYMVSTKDFINDAHVLIVSHDMLTRASEKLLQRKFGVIIIDESHTFKNFKAKGTQIAVKISKQTKRVILLSGTPALSRPSELFTQLSIIDDKFFGNFMEYSRRYCDGKQTNFGWNASGQSNLQELEIILAKKFMIRRTKDEVLASMPTKSQEIVTLDVNLNQFSNEDKRCLTALAEKYNSKKGSEKHSILLTFFSESARLKIPSVSSYVLQILEEGKKFLLFAHHQIMLNAIEQILNKKNKKYIRIDGNTTSDQRKYFVDKFQRNENCICALLSITAANAGITLTAAQLVIFAELHWNPSILSQAESRAHRIGQNKPVVIRYLIAPGTADDSIWPLLKQKQNILTEAGLCKDSFEDVQVKKQTNHPEVKLTEGMEYKTRHSTMDISSYFESPSKKQKINDSVVSDLNESLLNDSLNLTGISFFEKNENSGVTGESTSGLNVEELLNDGFDDIFSNIDI